MIDYLRDPQAIYRQSFATIRAEVPLASLPADFAPVALRLIHACGMTDIVGDLAFSPGAAAAGRAALAGGAAVLCDARMVAEGIIAGRVPAGNRVVTLTEAEGTAARAEREATTRSAAAIAGARGLLGGAIVAIGNAPTALFRLLEELDAGAPRPALILGFPVGFVGAAEAKAELARDPRGCAYITLHGRRGGSALAAAAVNALAGNVEDAP